MKLDPGVDAEGVPPGAAAAPIDHAHQYSLLLLLVKYVQWTSRVSLKTNKMENWSEPSVCAAM
jgi:hypothetical protein